MLRSSPPSGVIPEPAHGEYAQCGRRALLTQLALGDGTYREFLQAGFSGVAIQAFPKDLLHPRFFHV
jgi:hypothetical protein